MRSQNTKSPTMTMNLMLIENKALGNFQLVANNQCNLKQLKRNLVHAHKHSL